MGPKCYKKETESLHCNLGGTDRSSRLQSHLDETEIPISETDLIRVCGSGYDILTRWRQIEGIGEAELDFWFGSYVDVRK